MLTCFAALLSACGSSDESTGSSDQPTFENVESLPPLETEADLVFTNGDSSTTLSLADLEEIETVRSEVDEPFIKSRTTFEGPTVDAVFASLGWDTAGEAHIWAINDYAYDIAMTDLVDGDAMIATRENGKAIPVDAGGPARIVFPDWSPIAGTEDAWVWSVGKVDVLDPAGA